MLALDPTASAVNVITPDLFFPDEMPRSASPECTMVAVFAMRRKRHADWLGFERLKSGLAASGCGHEIQLFDGPDDLRRAIVAASGYANPIIIQASPDAMTLIRLFAFPAVQDLVWDAIYFAPENLVAAVDALSLPEDRIARLNAILAHLRPLKRRV